MSPFAGFDMPIRYTDITDEHLAVRNAVGVFDVSHMGEIFVTGPDAEKFVNHIFTNDIRGYYPGKILYGMMLYPDGGVVDDLLVYREYKPESFLLVVNASNIDKDYKYICDNAAGFDVKIDNQSAQWGQVAIQGPKAEETVQNVLGIADASHLGFYEFYNSTWNGNRLIVSRTGYTGEDGFELYTTLEGTYEIWDKLIAAGVKPCGLGCRDTLRFEAGLPLYGDELSAEISPIMAGLGMFCKLDKEEFIGREALAEQKANGTAKKLVGIEVHDRAIPRAGYPVELEDGTQVGVVTTGYHSISLDKSICFALVDSKCAALGTPPVFGKQSQFDGSSAHVDAECVTLHGLLPPFHSGFAVRAADLMLLLFPPWRNAVARQQRAQPPGQQRGGGQAQHVFHQKGRAHQQKRGQQFHLPQQGELDHASQVAQQQPGQPPEPAQRPLPPRRQAAEGRHREKAQQKAPGGAKEDVQSPLEAGKHRRARQPHQQIDQQGRRTGFDSQQIAAKRHGEGLQCEAYAAGHGYGELRADRDQRREQRGKGERSYFRCHRNPVLSLCVLGTVYTIFEEKGRGGGGKKSVQDKGTVLLSRHQGSCVISFQQASCWSEDETLRGRSERG